MGIQVDPSVTSRYAMQRFGEDYTKLVMQCSDLSAFAEAAQDEVARLERQAKLDLETITTLEGLLREAGAVKTQLEAEVAQLSQPSTAGQVKDSPPAEPTE